MACTNENCICRNVTIIRFVPTNPPEPPKFTALTFDAIPDFTEKLAEDGNFIPSLQHLAAVRVAKRYIPINALLRSILQSLHICVACNQKKPREWLRKCDGYLCLSCYPLTFRMKAFDEIMTESQSTNVALVVRAIRLYPRNKENILNYISAHTPLRGIKRGFLMADHV